MLRTLQIENYVLIRELNIQFDRGLTVITGETGAGKSILLGAISLILGNRAETDVLLDKAKKCIVEGTFDITELPIQDFFTQNDLDYQPQTIIRREINEHGKSRAFINDTPVTLNLLRELSSVLIDIHSQHQNLLLQNSDFRLEILDQYAQNQILRAKYQQVFALHEQAERQYRELKAQCTEAARREEFNLFTIQELDNAQLEAGEQERLEQRIRLLNNAENIKAHLYAATQQLSENEDGNILQQLKSVQDECGAIQDLGPDFEDIHQRLKSVSIELKDLAYEINHKESEIDINPKELEHLNERIDLIFSLQHKYQVDDIQGLIDLSASLKKEISQYSDKQEQLSALDEKKSQLANELREWAHKLSETRQAVTGSFQQKIASVLKQLGMPDSQFNINMLQTEEPQRTGIDQVEFLFSANKGMVPANLSKIASGGEMSRIMLALKSTITDNSLLPTIIFDEIDTGISGETANKVAAVMRVLASKHQVIAISHLPQIAASGDQHYLVYKKNIDNKAVSNIRLLDADERTEAIAGMLSGADISDAARSAAQALLNSNCKNI